MRQEYLSFGALLRNVGGEPCVTVGLMPRICGSKARICWCTATISRVRREFACVRRGFHVYARDLQPYADSLQAHADSLQAHSGNLRVNAVICRRTPTFCSRTPRICSCTATVELVRGVFKRVRHRFVRNPKGCKKVAGGRSPRRPPEKSLVMTAPRRGAGRHNRYFSSNSIPAALRSSLNSSTNDRLR